MLTWAKKHVHHKQHKDSNTEDGEDTEKEKWRENPKQKISQEKKLKRDNQNETKERKNESEKSPSFSRKFASLRKMATSKMSPEKKDKSRNPDKGTGETSKSPEKVIKEDSKSTGKTSSSLDKSLDTNSEESVKVTDINPDTRISDERRPDVGTHKIPDNGLTPDNMTKTQSQAQKQEEQETVQEERLQQPSNQHASSPSDAVNGKHVTESTEGEEEPVTNSKSLNSIQNTRNSDTIVETAVSANGIETKQSETHSETNEQRLKSGKKLTNLEKSESEKKTTYEDLEEKTSVDENKQKETERTTLTITKHSDITPNYELIEASKNDETCNTTINRETKVDVSERTINERRAEEAKECGNERKNVETRNEGDVSGLEETSPVQQEARIGFENFGSTKNRAPTPPPKPQRTFSYGGGELITQASNVDGELTLNNVIQGNIKSPVTKDSPKMTHREESIERLNKTDKESPQKDGKENEDKLKETDLSYLQKSDLEVPKKLLIIEPTEPSQANSLEDKPAVSPNDKGDSKDVKIGFVVTNVSKHGKADSKDVTESKEEDNKYKENEEGAVVTENSQTSGQTEEKTPIEIPQKIPAIPDMAPEKVKMEENPMGKQTDKESSAITDTQQEENLTEIIHKPEDSQVTNENHTEVQKKPEDLTESKEETLKINESFTKTSENSPETPVKLQNLTETQTDKPPLPPKNKNYIFGSSSYRNGLGGKGIGSGSSKIGSSLPSDVNSCATGAKESTDGWRLRERSGTESDACSTSLLSSNKGLSKDASTSSPTLKITHAPDRPPSPLTTNSRALNSSDSSLGKESSTSNTSLTVTQAERGTAQAAMGGSLPASPSAPKRHKRAPPVPVARSLHSLNSSQSKAAASNATTTNPVPKPRKSISLNPFDSEDDEEEEGRKEEIIKEEQERNEERKPEEQLGMATKEAQATDSKTTVDTKPTQMPVPVPRKTVPYNPFDSDDDDEETSEPARRNSQTTITTNSTEPAGKSGQTKASISSTPAKPPTISKNPFESDEDEDMEETEFTPNRTSSPAKFGSTSITSTSNQNNASTTSSRLNDSVSSMNSTRTHNTTTSTNPFDEDGDYEEDSMNESFQRDSKIRQSYNVGAQSQLVRDGPRASLPPTYRSRTGKKKRPAPPPPGQNAQDRVRNESQESLSRGSSMSSLTKGGSGSTTSLTTPPSTTTNTPPKRPPPPRPPPPKVKN